ncbi:Wadjet anti-phage system protein JetD domain-containing protein [Caenispirillum bisanense]|uniref:Wadjet anti-phage system protein JetD domain-containing protein n=1 Tax=Caenispirillum bisanense TaxID=414052 RepID=UPI0031DF0BA7
MSEQRVRQALEKLLRKGGLRPRTAVEKIATEADISRLAVRDGLRMLATELQGVTQDGDVVATLRWRIPLEEVVRPDLVEWRRRVAEAPEDRAPLLHSPPATVWELPSEDQAVLAEAAAGTLQPVRDADHYVLSAVNLMGSSKALDALGLTQAVVASHGGLVQRPLFAVTAGPANPESVLLVENPSCFGALLASGFCQRRLVVCAFGYGLSIENLGRRLAAGQVIACPAAGDRVDLPSVLAERPSFFWGDLDLEGLRIFEALREAIPGLRLPAVYATMEKMLDDRRTSHPYSKLFGAGKPNQRAPRGELPEVRHLAERCRYRAVDQEAVWPLPDWVQLGEEYRIAAPGAGTPGTRCSEAAAYDVIP